jgi:hypothetical protein
LKTNDTNIVVKKDSEVYYINKYKISSIAYLFILIYNISIGITIISFILYQINLNNYNLTYTILPDLNYIFSSLYRGSVNPYIILILTYYFYLLYPLLFPIMFIIYIKLNNKITYSHIAKIYVNTIKLISVTIWIQIIITIIYLINDFIKYGYY